MTDQQQPTYRRTPTEEHFDAIRRALIDTAPERAHHTAHPQHWTLR